MDNFNQQSVPAASRFRGEVIQRIYRVWLLRRFLPVVIAEVVGLSLIFYLLAQAVFVRRVFENGLNVFFDYPPSLVSFGISAFLSAPLATKLLAGAAALLAALILRHLTQGLLRLILVRENYFSKLGKE